MRTSSVFSISSAALGCGITAYEAIGHYTKSPQVFVATATLGVITSLFMNLVTMKGNEVSGVLSLGIGVIGPFYRALPKTSLSSNIIQKMSVFLERVSQVYKNSLINLDLATPNAVSSGFSFGFMAGQLASSIYYNTISSSEK